MLQGISTNIVVISIALLAITFILIQPAWRGVLRYNQILSPDDRRDMRTPLCVVFALSVLAILPTISMGLVDPILVQNIEVIITLGLGASAGVYYTVVLLRDVSRRPTKDAESKSRYWRKTGTISYFLSAFHLGFCATLLTACIVGSIDVALGIRLSSDIQGDFDLSRWTLSAATMAFLFGFVFLALGCFADICKPTDPASEE